MNARVMLLPSQIDWPALIGELMARGYSLRMIAAHCHVARSTVRDWRAGAVQYPRGRAPLLLLDLCRGEIPPRE